MRVAIPTPQAAPAPDRGAESSRNANSWSKVLQSAQRESLLALVLPTSRRMTTDVRLYTLSTCPYCEKARQYFTERGIPFRFTDYDRADEATQVRIQRDMEAAGANGFPFALIGNEAVEGYAPGRYAKLLGG